MSEVPDPIGDDFEAGSLDRSRHDPVSVAEWETYAGRVTGAMAALGAVGIGAAVVLDLPLAVVTSSSAILLLAALLNRVAHWLDEGDGTVRGAIALRVADLWHTSLGSFWGLLSFVRFIQLEIATLLGEYAAAGGWSEWLRGEYWELLFGFSLRSIQNAIAAAVWPITWIAEYGLLGIVGLVLGATVWDAIHDRVDERLERAGIRRIPPPEDQPPEAGASGQT